MVIKRAFIVFAALLLFLSACPSYNKDDKNKANNSDEAEKSLAEVEARVDSPVAAPGDIIKYVLELRYSPGVKTEIPEFGRKISELKIVNSGKEGPEEADGIIGLKKWYELEAGQEGSYKIPKVTIKFIGTDGKILEKTTSEIFIEVKTDRKGISGKKDIIDIKPLEKIERDYRKIVLTAVIIIIILAIILSVYFYYQKRKKKAEALPFIPAHKLALQEFSRLKGKKLLEKGELRKYYFAFSLIFRKYLERRFSLSATERTTEEIIPELEKIKTIGGDYFLLGKEFLLATDFVKFAKHLPGKDGITKIEEDFLKFIEVTKEEEVSSNDKVQEIV
ncbi:MAG: hypothetical protein UT02_C0032G0006 [Parcubacteria group bacterium GW2011_GWC2_38_7]|nr:MAG: hypothetical protein UT02_C0032G0006 [Parcubacteria group bacterium GW2011_GWC2_38_7]